jgi:hypothetical protein
MIEGVWNINGVILTGENQGTVKKLVFVPLYPPQFPHILAWD